MMTAFALNERTKRKFFVIFVFSACLYLPNILSASIKKIDDQWIKRQSRIGPYPRSQSDLTGLRFDKTKTMMATLISGVPAYLGRHGSGPTAVGMVIGYYDSHGYPSLIPGESINQGENVNQAIASNGNYDDYCLPLDNSPILLKDKSEPPGGDTHQDNCIADFLKTSQSYYHNYYGWSWSVDIAPGFEDYINKAGKYTGFAAFHPFDQFSWEKLKHEIDNDRPMVALVDADGKGWNLFVTIVGYNSSGPLNYYGCYNTWDKDLHWYPYRAAVYGSDWGVACFYTFDVFAGLFPPKNVKLQRIENNFIFFKEMINRISLEADERNKGVSVRHKIYRKKKDAAEDPFPLLMELDERQAVFEDRGLKKQDIYIYRIIAVDINTGKESAAVEIWN